MFRVQDNVPEVYINESRDFQILARLSDVLFSGIKYDIDSMTNILDATLARDTMLELMCTKIGFFPRIKIDANVLKYIIASFPYIIKNKGTRKGIEYAVNAILKAENNPDAIGRPVITITGEIEEDNEGQDNLKPYTVYIITTIQIYNKAALREVLRYVLPAGFNYQILTYYDVNNGSAYKTLFEQQNEIRAIRTPAIQSSALRAADIEVSFAEDTLTNERLTSFADKVVGAYDTTQIITSDMYRDANDKIGSTEVIVEGIAEILPTYNVALKVGDSIVETLAVVKYNTIELPNSAQYQGLTWYVDGQEITEPFEFGTTKILGNMTLVGLSNTEHESTGGNE